MTQRKETQDKFTERAIRAVDAGKYLPPIVYLPKRLRGQKTRLTVDQVQITTEPPTIAENHLRILEADPLGFLIAMMHGQPVPEFHVTDEGSLLIQYYVADPQTRIRVAQWLAHKVTIKNQKDNRDADGAKGDPDNWDEIVKKRNAEERAEAQS